MSATDALLRDLDGLDVETQPQKVKRRSRDFYWYSPVLKKQLDAVTAEAVVTPRDEAEVVRTLRAAFARGVPVTPRGGGTGNYGQAMPLRGGVVLDLSRNRSRRYCSTACANRNAVAAYRARRAED